jgi:hypothetical protein
MRQRLAYLVVGTIETGAIENAFSTLWLRVREFLINLVKFARSQRTALTVLG